MFGFNRAFLFFCLSGILQLSCVRFCRSLRERRAWCSNPWAWDQINTLIIYIYTCTHADANVDVVCVCKYVCMCVYIYHYLIFQRLFVCIFTCTYAFYTSIYLRICIYICYTYVCVIFNRKQIDTYRHACLYLFVCEVCMYVNVGTYLYSYPYLYLYLDLDIPWVPIQGPRAGSPAGPVTV